MEPPLRIVKGTFAGRRLTSPADKRVRPTAEPVRDAIMELVGAELKGTKVLDLFAGTGALGLEAISRGAAIADFVEFRPASLHALRANIGALRLTKKCRVYKKDAVPFVEALKADAYDIAFVDPPYGSAVLDRVFDSWKQTPFAKLLVVEHAKDYPMPGGALRKHFGETTVTIYRAARSEKREA
ncbi:MAG TPA: RsmD family RNA methyltransferase [Gemmatimonadales bacterium]|nr:RsmD family RNA methyltransferase [Gemmatimonadales bacterium]